VTWTNWLILLLVLLIFSWYLSNVAGRLDRLHLKAEAARASLDTQLAHRTNAVGRLVEKLNGTDPDTLNLRSAWRDALMSELVHLESTSQWQIESELTLRINEFFNSQPALASDPALSDFMGDLAAACRRVQYARAFHNDAQKAALEVRGRWLVRTFRLAGRARLPRVIEFDDQIPKALLNK
jgi:hypothetical protein